MDIFRSLVLLTCLLAGCFAPEPGEDGGDALALDLGDPSSEDGPLYDLQVTHNDLALLCGPGNCPGCCQGQVCVQGTSVMACGSSGQVCQRCATAQSCLAGKMCGLDPNERWELSVQNATINSLAPDGTAWDFPGGAPDPYVTFNGVLATSVESDTHNPFWGQGQIFTLSDLQRGVSIRVFDKDVTVDDLIAGPRTLQVTEANLASGRITWSSWEYVSVINFQLKKR